MSELERPEPHSLPLIGVSACVRRVNGHPYHAVVEKYLQAVADGAGAMPLMIPALGSGWSETQLRALVHRLDALLITGSPSNVEPHLYEGPASRHGTLHDPARDATTLPLIRMAVAEAVPVLAICRGIQELNVALGGTLHQRLHDLPGRLDHRSHPRASTEEKHLPAHPISIRRGGLFAELAEGATEIVVNSLHAQGIDRISKDLAVEATAPDGTIEAVVAPNAPAFTVGVQWHPEWRHAETVIGRNLFARFGDAARARHMQRGVASSPDARPGIRAA